MTMPTGYSGKPLVQKLGYQPKQRIYLFDAPKDFTNYMHDLGLSLGAEQPTWAHEFFTTRSQIAKFLQVIDKNSSLKAFWVS